MENITKLIEEKSKNYRSIPFWSWNDKLEPERLKKQIKDMKRLNFGGFFMHARSGLETEYLSKEWYDAIKVCIDEGKRLDMQAWSYDENGWPSGFAGGKLLTCDENYAHYLEYKILDYFDSEAFAVYIKENDSYRLIKENEKTNEYHTIYRCADSSYIDTLNPRITKEFIKYTHEDYKEKCGKDFGTAMPGFFTDEPQYYRWKTLWSDTLRDEFLKKYGYDVMPCLMALFVNYKGAEIFRYDYYSLCHELFINNFIKIIYEWCNENGAQITGHAIEESFLAGQMWCCGGVMPFYEYMSIPGVDYLTKMIGNDISSKQVGSVAAQLGKEKVLSEMFACCGWDVTPLELKRVAEHQYYGGVNLMCQHLYPYSIRGQRKRDYPCFYSEHSPWQDMLGDFNRYFERLGCVLAQGKEKANVLVIHPIHSAYLDFIRINDRESIKDLEEDFAALTDTLAKNSVPFHYGDETLMRKYGKVKDGKIIIGHCEYDTVILPLLNSLDQSTNELLSQFCLQNGKLCADKGVPTRVCARETDTSQIKANITLAQIIADSEVKISSTEDKVDFRVMQRKTDNRNLYYILNQTKKAVNSQISIKGINSICILDLETLKTKALDYSKTEQGITFKLNFKPVQSYILIDEVSENRLNTEPKPISHTPFEIAAQIENAYTLDYAAVSYDGITYTEKRPIVQIKDNLLKDRYKGKLYLKYTFVCDEIPKSLNCAIERIKSQRVYINGTEIDISKENHYDSHFGATDILPLIHCGENEIILKLDYFQRDYVYYVLYGGVSESLRNCLNFDCEIESVYLYGNFALKTDKSKFKTASDTLYTIYNGDFKIIESGKIDLEGITESGYPFFCDKLTLICKAKSDGNIFNTDGDFTCGEIFVNGKKRANLMFDYSPDVGEVKAGDEITLIVYESMRNLMGPHHNTDCNPIAAPKAFSFEGEWDGDRCENYTKSYSFRKFSVR